MVRISMKRHTYISDLEKVCEDNTEVQHLLSDLIFSYLYRSANPEISWRQIKLLRDFLSDKILMFDETEFEVRIHFPDTFNSKQLAYFNTAINGLPKQLNEIQIPEGEKS